MHNLKIVIDAVGGVTAASKVCGISPRGIYKWLNSGGLPRTDYTGETDYAGALAAASDGQFTAREIRDQCRPGQHSSAA